MSTRFNTILCLSFLTMLNSTYPMERKTFEKNSYVRVVRGAKYLRGKVMKIEGTSEDIWGIKDVDDSLKAFRIGALIKYLSIQEPVLVFLRVSIKLTILPMKKYFNWKKFPNI